MPVHTPLDRDELIDAARARTLLGLLGPARLDALLDVLAERIGQIAHWSRAPEKLIQMVHQTHGSAGTMGLTRVMRHLQALEAQLIVHQSDFRAAHSIVENFAQTIAREFDSSRAAMASLLTSSLTQGGAVAEP